MSLDVDIEEFRKSLYKVSDLIVDLYSDIENKKVFCGKNEDEVRELFEEELPINGVELDKLLETTIKDVLSTSTLNTSPNYMAYVSSAGTYAGIVAELLCSALNQNCSKWHCSPAGSEIERVIVEWIAKFVGYPSTFGSLVSGGTAANMSCLAACRKIKAPFDVSNDGLKAGPQLTFYTSTETHSCVEKSIDSLGVGKKNLRKISIKDDFTIDVKKLEEQIVLDKNQGYYPVCIIANGGTVNTGAVDPLDTIAELCKKYNLWFHVDAAYGGPASGTKLVKHLFKGIEKADSVALDPHKWFYTPIEAGCALVKDIHSLKATFSILPDYLKLDTEKFHRFEFMEHTFQLSRSFRALKIYMTFKAYGAKGLRKSIEENILTMKYLEELIKKSDDFELLAPVTLSTVCFRYKTRDKDLQKDENYLSKLNKEILDMVEKDGRIFVAGTIINGKTAIRACCVNHRAKKQHVDRLLSILKEIARNITLDHLEKVI